MRRISLEYPLIFGNSLCDGTWHDVTVSRLYRVGNGPFYLMEYFDEKYKKSCVTVLVRSGESFRKAPLLEYGSIEKLVSGVLVPANLGILPFSIEAYSDVVYDLVDLTLRRMAYATAPPSPPSPPSGGGGTSSTHARQLLRVRLDCQLPSLRGQTWITPRDCSCKVATLFIHEHIIYSGKLDKDGFVIEKADPAWLFYVLANYYIIWREINFCLITDGIVIADALGTFCNEMLRRGSNVIISEIDLRSFEAQKAGALPPWLRGIAHRYSVKQLPMNR